MSRRTIDFVDLPPMVAQEIRYAVGTKIERGDWTPNTILLAWLEALVSAVRATDVRSLLDRRPEDWALLIGQDVRGVSAADVRSYARTFFVTLHRALVIDPWEDDVWLWKGGFDHMVHADAYSNTGNNIHWEHVTQDWLRVPVKRWARECLSTGSRAWGTVLGWATALRRLSEYLSAEGVSDPLMLDRSVFLDFLVSLNEAGASKTTLARVNTAASLLATVQAEVPGTAFGSAVFLRYGENVVRKLREPRPYPDDVVTLVDTRVLTDPELEPAARHMLQLTRWGGLRISELVALPINALRHNGKGGYWVEYFMTKTKKIRAFPIPDDLAASLLVWRLSVLETYGRDSEYLFPSPKRSSVIRQRVQPWSASGFRDHIRAGFERNGIAQSALTGEFVTGGEIHRYRHTIGTTLLNNGWTQREVQEFLGHDSPTMTSNYAAILDETLTRKVREFRESHVPATDPVEDPGVERLRTRFVYALPDGYCTLPSNQHCETREHPCTGCAFFEGKGSELRPVHENRQRRLKLLVEDSSSSAQRDLNQRALNDVECLLDTTEDEHAAQ